MVLARGAAHIADQLFGWHPRGWGGGFLAHLHSAWCYDDPKILRYSNRQFGLIGADGGHFAKLIRLACAYRSSPSVHNL